MQCSISRSIIGSRPFLISVAAAKRLEVPDNDIPVSPSLPVSGSMRYSKKNVYDSRT